mgnify:CR=1 FL=1
MQRNGQTLLCICGKKFYRKKSLILLDKNYFCSNKCSGNSKRKQKTEFTCICGNVFYRAPSYTKFRKSYPSCSLGCAARKRIRPWAFKSQFRRFPISSCIVCQTTKYEHYGKGMCEPCYRKQDKNRKAYSKRYLKKYFKTSYGRMLRRKRDYIRRSRCKETDIDVRWIITLRNDTDICVVCGIVMVEDGMLSNGKTLDHILPLNVGGKHMKINVRYICRTCNIKRPRDGHDISYSLIV